MRTMYKNGVKVSALEERFKNFLSTTSSPATGKKYSPSTVNGYMSGIRTICKEERCGWEDLPPQINSLVFIYGPNGDKCEIGEKGKRTIINALRAFQRYLFVFE